MFEIREHLRIPINYVSPVIRHLTKVGKLEATSERRINPISGKRVIVWRRCEKEPPRTGHVLCPTCKGKGKIRDPHRSLF